MVNIAAIAGSYRAGSYNKRILALAVAGARDAGAEVMEIDLRDYPLPIFNADDVESKGFDKKALDLQRVLNENAGFLIASPEYNGSIPGGLKNAIDWASRASDEFAMYQVFKGKTAAIMTAAPGQFGGLRCLGHLRSVLTIMSINVIPFELAVPFVAQKFDGDSGAMTDEKTTGLLKKLGSDLVAALE